MGCRTKKRRTTGCKPKFQRNIGSNDKAEEHAHNLHASSPDKGSHVLCAVFVYSNVSCCPMSIERSLLAFELSAIIPSNSLKSQAVCSTFDDSPYKYLFHFGRTVALNER